jgi:hypothetical protein
MGIHPSLSNIRPAHTNKSFNDWSSKHTQDSGKACNWVSFVFICALKVFMKGVFMKGHMRGISFSLPINFCIVKRSMTLVEQQD